MPLAAVLARCAAWEPILRDSWGHMWWYRWNEFSLGKLAEFAWDNYLHINPRLGQTATLLLFAPGAWHVAVMVALELGLLWLLTALALARRPSLRSSDDALMFATITGIVAVTTPTLGPMLFYRPFVGNYLFGHVLSVAWLVPYRFHQAAPRPRSLALAPAMLVLGFAAGMCNEHTDPTLVALGALALVVFVRRGERPSVWMIAGLVGVIAGSAALFFAPAQAVRYNGLAAEHSLLGRIVARGLVGNFKLFENLARYELPALAWIALAVVARRSIPVAERSRDRAPLVGVLAALAIVVTLLASPKQGERLYFATVTLAATALAAWLVPFVRVRARTTRAIGAVAWTFAIVATGFVAVRCVMTYAVVGPEGAERIAKIEGARPGDHLAVPAFTLAKSRWFLGEDLHIDSHRATIAGEYRLSGLDLVGGPGHQGGGDEP